MTSAQTSEASFRCAVCGELAGRVRLLTAGERWTDRSTPALEALADIDGVTRPADQARLVVEWFYGVDALPVSADHLSRLTASIAAVDESALYSLAYRYAPFYCPECPASYCGDHWAWHNFTDGDIEGIEGNCPQGHFHVLQY